MSRIFTCIEIVFRLLGWWGDFLKYLDERKIQETAVQQADRQRAVSASPQANDDKAIFDNQNTISNNLPNK